MSRTHKPEIFEKLLPRGPSSVAGTADCPIPSVFARNVYAQHVVCGPEQEDLCESKHKTGPQGPAGEHGKHGSRGWQGITGSCAPEGKRGKRGAQGKCGPRGGAGPQGKHGPNGVTGPIGKQGAQGYQGSCGVGVDGPQGVNGPQGEVGSNFGPQGLPGVPGVPGLTGLSGFQGPQGFGGFDGLDGAQGFVGPQGPTGLAGDAGPPGPPGGPQGASGPQGVVGRDGPIGVSGTPGVDGPQGPAAADGVQGAQGPQGLMGSSGFPGQNGAQGIAGTNGFQGLNGAQGFQGSAGLSIEGAQGFPGNDGTPGLDGPQGVAGNNTGETGPQGPQGFQGPNQEVVGPPGPQGAMGPQGIGGPQGVMGPQGMTLFGPQGFQGPAGSSATTGAANFVFGTDSEQKLAPNQILVNTTTGDFLEPIFGAAMTWRKIVDLGTSDPGMNVIAASMSDDAKLIVAIMNQGTPDPFLFTSTDQGQLFSSNPFNTQDFTCVDCSSGNSGQTVICGTSGNQLFWSNDSGQNLTPSGPTRNWASVSVNAAGNFAVACADGDFIYTSSDGGQTWSVPRASSQAWLQVMTDNVGTNCIAMTSDQVWFSTDAGVTWGNVTNAPADLQGPFRAIHLSPDGTQAFVTNTSGTIFRKTVPAGAWSTFRPSGGLDVGVSTDETKVLVINTNSTSSFSQDSAATFYTNPIVINATPPMRVPVVLTTDGQHAIMVTNDNQIWYGSVATGNIVLFNSLVSDTAVTSHLLTGLVPIPGVLAASDSILQGFGKFLNMQLNPIGGSCHSFTNAIATVSAAQNAPTPVQFPGPGPNFQLAPANNDPDFKWDLSTGGLQYFGSAPVLCNILLGFSMRSLTSTDDIYAGFNGPSSVGICRLTPTNKWQCGVVFQRVMVNPLGSFLLSFKQTTNPASQSYQFSGINWQVTRA